MRALAVSDGVCAAQAGAVHIIMLIVGRIFLGAGIGLANQVSQGSAPVNMIRNAL